MRVETPCATCRTPIRWTERPTGGWWSHDVHPADEHDARPVIHLIDIRDANAVCCRIPVASISPWLVTQHPDATTCPDFHTPPAELVASVQQAATSFMHRKVHEFRDGLDGVCVYGADPFASGDVWRCGRPEWHKIHSVPTAIAGYVCVPIDKCNCAGGDPEIGGGAHEAHCGWEPFVRVPEVPGEINRLTAELDDWRNQAESDPVRRYRACIYGQCMHRTGEECPCLCADDGDAEDDCPMHGAVVQAMALRDEIDERTSERDSARASAASIGVELALSADRWARLRAFIAARLGLVDDEAADAYDTGRTSESGEGDSYQRDAYRDVRKWLDESAPKRAEEEVGADVQP